MIEFVECENAPERVSWPFIAYTDVDLRIADQALKTGRASCLYAIDLFTLYTGQPTQLHYDGVRASNESGQPVIVDFWPTPVSRIDELADDEREHLSRAFALTPFTATNSTQSARNANAIHWYNQAIAEQRPIDAFLKLYIILEIFVPNAIPGQPKTSFSSRAVETLVMSFRNEDRGKIEDAILRLTFIRNKLIHDGQIDEQLLTNLHTLHYIVLVLLGQLLSRERYRQAFTIPILQDTASTNYRMRAGLLRKPGTAQIKGSPISLDVGDPVNKDGKHLIYAGEEGGELRLHFAPLG